MSSEKKAPSGDQQYLRRGPRKGHQEFVLYGLISCVALGGAISLYVGWHIRYNHVNDPTHFWKTCCFIITWFYVSMVWLFFYALLIVFRGLQTWMCTTFDILMIIGHIHVAVVSRGLVAENPGNSNFLIAGGIKCVYFMILLYATSLVLRTMAYLDEKERSPVRFARSRYRHSRSSPDDAGMSTRIWIYFIVGFLVGVGFPALLHAPQKVIYPSTTAENCTPSPTKEIAQTTIVKPQVFLKDIRTWQPQFPPSPFTSWKSYNQDKEQQKKVPTDMEYSEEFFERNAEVWRHPELWEHNKDGNPFLGDVSGDMLKEIEKRIKGVLGTRPSLERSMQLHALLRDLSIVNRICDMKENQDLSLMVTKAYNEGGSARKGLQVYHRLNLERDTRVIQDLMQLEQEENMYSEEERHKSVGASLAAYKKLLHEMKRTNQENNRKLRLEQDRTVMAAQAKGGSAHQSLPPAALASEIQQQLDTNEAVEYDKKRLASFEREKRLKLMKQTANPETKMVAAHASGGST